MRPVQSTSMPYSSMTAAPASSLKGLHYKPVLLDTVELSRGKTGRTVFSSPYFPAAGGRMFRNFSGVSKTQISRLFEENKPDVCWKSPSPFTGYVTFQGLLVSQDQSLYSGAMGSLMRIDTSNGSIKWKKELKGEIRSWPALEGKDGSLLVWTNEKKLHALNPYNGEEKWSYKMRDSICKPSVGPDGTIYVEDSSDLVALNSDGNEKFRVNVGKKGDEFSNKVSAIADDGSLFLKSKEGITALSSSGAVLWNAPEPDIQYFPGDPGKVYLSGLDDKVVVRDAASGKLLWETKEGSHTISAGRDKVFLGRDNAIICMDDKGRVLWKNDAWKDEADAWPHTHFLSDDGVLYVSHQDRVLEALDPESGKPLLSLDLENGEKSFIQSAMSKNGILYLTGGKTVYGIDTKTSKLISRKEIDKKIEDIATDSSGERIYIKTSASGGIGGRIPGEYEIKAVENPVWRESIKEKKEEELPHDEISDNDGYILIGDIKLDKKTLN
ncbi:MAG: PQQ-binding-like beta-propeller repeat protein [Candidatus Xenobiia bacterium LiM19]